jgi:ubiquinone/menaquinone biosynthesis C-methylase UbiE
MVTEDYRQSVLAIAEAIAPGWERRRSFVEETAAPVREWMIEALAPAAGGTLLELAAGAGDVGFTAAGRIGASGRLISTDLSPAMLGIARRRGAELGLDNVDYRVMDAQRIELESDCVDGVLCRFGYMLMPDPPAALTESRRVLRGGGRLSLAVWGPPERNPFFALIGTTCVQHGHLPPPDPAEPGIFNLADADRLQALLADAGFDDVRLEEVGVRFVFGSVDEYIDIVADTAGPLGLALQDLAEDERSAVAQELRGRLTPFVTPGGYALSGVALAAVAS